MTPMLITLYFQDIRWTLIAIIWFEPFEQLFTSLNTGGTVADPNLESLFGSEVGDALLQGGTGLWMGIMLLYIFDLPLLLSTSYRAEKLQKRWKRYKYFFFAGAHIALVFLLGWSKADGTVNYGLYVNAGCQALIWFVLYPWVLYTDKENDMVWNATFDGDPYPKHKRNLFFYLAGIIIIGIQMSNGGWHYLANDWFQVWATEAGIVTLLTIAAIVIAKQRDDPYMIVGFSAAYVIASGVAFFITSRVVNNNAYAWTALALVIAALLAIVLAEIRWKRPDPYNVNYSRRLEKTKGRSLEAHYRVLKDL